MEKMHQLMPKNKQEIEKRLKKNELMIFDANIFIYKKDIISLIFKSREEKYMDQFHQLKQIKDKHIEFIREKFYVKYNSNKEFKENIDSNFSRIDDYCKKAALLQFAKVIYIRACEDHNAIKKDMLSKSGISKWNSLVSFLSYDFLLKIAFMDLGKSINIFYHSIFDEIGYVKDKEKNSFEAHLKEMLDFMSLGFNYASMYKAILNEEERKEFGIKALPSPIIDFMINSVDISPAKTILDANLDYFLVKSYDVLREKMLKTGWSED
ncbi:MAG: hypothetical protein ACE5KE_04485, partial [Methanosarcinales archaeon]